MIEVRHAVSLSILGECAVHGTIQDKWKPFPAILENSGVDIHCIENARVEHYFVIDHQHQSKELNNKLTPENRTLVRLEPRCVNPNQYQPSIEKLYGNIVVVSPLQQNKANQILWRSGYLPDSKQLVRKIYECRNIEKLPEICIVNQNKFSFIKGELYSFRQSAINRFLASGITLNLAGGDWGKSRIWNLKSRLRTFKDCLSYYRILTLKGFFVSTNISSPNLIYHGRVSDSVDFMANFKFALVIENEASYVSEKLINAIVAGCVPIYCGPNLSQFGLPSGIAIETGKDLSSIITGFQSLSELEIHNVLLTGLEWLKSVETQERWGVKPSYFRLARILSEIIEK
jgi:hypothetical protein